LFLCHLQPLLLTSGLWRWVDTLKCHKRILCKFGSGFTKRPFEWKSFATKETGHEEICQETVLKVDVAWLSFSCLLSEKSLLVRSKGSGHVQVYANRPGILAAMYIKCCESDLHNSAAISQVLLDYINISGLGSGYRDLRDLPGAAAENALFRGGVMEHQSPGKQMLEDKGTDLPLKHAVLIPSLLTQRPAGLSLRPAW
uniref:Uncharacterized protein n=1 Tax=Peromyscus maniculatus bairdii TaxID=230844 RepID=A0A8C8UGF6_PERMB